jgi:TrmH family RNA methyltransferase
MLETITSASNPLIKQARSLRQKKARDESGLFLVEGILHVGEAAQAGWDIETVLYAPGRLRSDFARELIDTLPGRGTRCQPVSESAFESFAEKENPQGIAALVRQRSLALEDMTVNRLAVAVVTPQDPGNLGAILRSLDAVGGDALFLLDGGVDPYHPSAVRASMGTLFWKPFVQASFADFTAWARQRNCILVGTSARASVDYLAFQPAARPVLLLLGSEQKGLSLEQLAACDERVSLPMRGRASSLNLAVAAGILLYALDHQITKG